MRCYLVSNNTLFYFHSIHVYFGNFPVLNPSFMQQISRPEQFILYYVIIISFVLQLVEGKTLVRDAIAAGTSNDLV